MGRAIQMEKDIDILKKDIKQLKTAFQGLASTVENMENTVTTTKTVDLHNKTKIKKTTKKKELVEETEG